MNIEQWKLKGGFHTISGKEIFVIDKGLGSKTLVILHGYPTFSYDYWMVSLKKYGKNWKKFNQTVNEILIELWLITFAL